MMMNTVFSRGWNSAAGALSAKSKVLTATPVYHFSRKLGNVKKLVDSQERQELD